MISINERLQEYRNLLEVDCQYLRTNYNTNHIELQKAIKRLSCQVVQLPLACTCYIDTIATSNIVRG